MYESYWHLKLRPFENVADPRFYFPAESHQAALLKLRYALEGRRGAALLAGPAGSGKTLIVQMLRQTLGDRINPWVHLVFPQMTTAELLAYLAAQLDGSAALDSNGHVQQSVQRIERFLAENAKQRRHAAVVLDEAHLIDDPRTFEALRLLLNFEFDGQPGLSVLLVGQPALLPMLERMPAFEERLAVKSLLRPFAPRESAEYVAYRLKLAGASEPIFQNDALVSIHTLTHGIPRRINRLCDLALLIGFAEQRQTLDAAHLEAVCGELVTVVPE